MHGVVLRGCRCLQVISSAIGNQPPPAGVVRAFNSFAKPEMTLPTTRERLIAVFDTKGVLKAQRNW